jgi:hypothetical protein
LIYPLSLSTPLQKTPPKHLKTLNECFKAFLEKGLINAQGELLYLPDVSIPKKQIEEKIKTLLEKEFQIKSNDNQITFSLSFNELISFLPLKFEKIVLVGSSVLKVFGSSFVKEVFSSLGYEIAPPLLEEFEREPNDFDLRIYSHQDIRQIKEIIIEILSKKKLDLNLSFEEKKRIVKQTFFKKLHVQNDGENKYATITLGPLELLIVNRLKREELFSRDATALNCLDIPEKIPFDLFQAFISIILKIIQAKNPETINSAGAFMYYALLCKGYRTLDSTLETKLIRLVDQKEIPKYFEKIVSDRFQNNKNSALVLKTHLLNSFPNAPLETCDLKTWHLETLLKACLEENSRIELIEHRGSFFLKRALDEKNQNSYLLTAPLSFKTVEGSSFNCPKEPIVFLNKEGLKKVIPNQDVVFQTSGLLGMILKILLSQLEESDYFPYEELPKTLETVKREEALYLLSLLKVFLKLKTPFSFTKPPFKNTELTLIKDFLTSNCLKGASSLLERVLNETSKKKELLIDLLEFIIPYQEEFSYKLFIKLQEASLLSPSEQCHFFLKLSPDHCLDLRLKGAKNLIKEHQKISPKEAVFDSILNLLNQVGEAGLIEESEPLGNFLRQRERHHLKALEIYQKKSPPLFERFFNKLGHVKSEEGKSLKETFLFHQFQLKKTTDFEGATPFALKLNVKNLNQKQKLEVELFFIALNQIEKAPRKAVYFLYLKGFKEHKTPELFLKLSSLASTDSQKEHLRTLFQLNFNLLSPLLNERSVLNLFKNNLKELIDQKPLSSTVLSVVLKHPSEPLIETLEEALETFEWSENLKDTLRNSLTHWIPFFKKLNDERSLNILYKIHLLNISISDPSLESLLIRQVSIYPDRVHELSKALKTPSLELIEALLEKSAFYIFWLKKKAVSKELTSVEAKKVIEPLFEIDEIDLAFELIEKFEIKEESLVLKLLSKSTKKRLPLLTRLFPNGPTTVNAPLFKTLLMEKEEPLPTLLFITKNPETKDQKTQKELLDLFLNSFKKEEKDSFSTQILLLVKEMDSFPFEILKETKKIKSQKTLLEIFALVIKKEIPKEHLNAFEDFIKQISAFLNKEEKLKVIKKYKFFSKELIENLATTSVLSLLQDEECLALDLIPFLEGFSREKAHTYTALKKAIHQFIDKPLQLEIFVRGIGVHMNLITKINSPILKEFFNLDLRTTTLIEEDPLLHLFCFYLEEILVDVKKFPFTIQFAKRLIEVSTEAPFIKKPLIMILKQIFAVDIQSTKEFVKLRFDFLNEKSTQTLLKTEIQPYEKLAQFLKEKTSLSFQQIPELFKEHLKTATDQTLIETFKLLNEIDSSFKPNEKAIFKQLVFLAIDSSEIFFLTSRNKIFFYETIGLEILKLPKVLEDKKSETLIYFFEKLAKLFITYHENCSSFTWEKQEILTPYLNLSLKALEEDFPQKEIFLNQTIDRLYRYFSKYALKNKQEIRIYNYYYPHFHALLKKHKPPNQLFEQLLNDRIKME